MTTTQIFQRLTNTQNLLEKRRKQIVEKYDYELSSIDAEIHKIKTAFRSVSDDNICKRCGGNGQERYTDAAGSRDYRKCRKCKGTGVLV